MGAGSVLPLHGLGVAVLLYTPHLHTWLPAGRLPLRVSCIYASIVRCDLFLLNAGHERLLLPATAVVTTTPATVHDLTSCCAAGEYIPPTCLYYRLRHRATPAL